MKGKYSLDEAIDSEVKEIEGHFKKDKWSLDFDFLVEDVFSHVEINKLKQELLNRLGKNYVVRKGFLQLKGRK